MLLHRNIRDISIDINDLDIIITTMIKFLKAIIGIILLLVCLTFTFSAYQLSYVTVAKSPLGISSYDIIISGDEQATDEDDNANHN